MSRIRVYIAAGALLLGLSGGMVAAIPASAGTGSLPAGTVTPQSVTGILNFISYPTLTYNPQECLGISGTNAGIYNCTFADDQNWHSVAENSRGDYQFKNDDGQCLGVAGGSTARGARVVGWTCNNHPDQFWGLDIINTQSYECTLFNYHSGYVPEASG